MKIFWYTLRTIHGLAAAHNRQCSLTSEINYGRRGALLAPYKSGQRKRAHSLPQAAEVVSALRLKSSMN
eukprot:scaffold664442_cov59-Prasinocladus_malaysianus.AAC.1